MEEYALMPEDPPKRAKQVLMFTSLMMANEKNLDKLSPVVLIYP